MKGFTTFFALLCIYMMLVGTWKFGRHAGEMFAAAPLVQQFIKSGRHITARITVGCLTALLCLPVVGLAMGCMFTGAALIFLTWKQLAILAGTGAFVTIMRAMTVRLAIVQED